MRRSVLSAPGLFLALLLVGATPLAAQQRAGDGCAAPAPVCAARDAVFAVSGFSPVASAVRLGPDLLVTNRHVVADRAEIEVFVPEGPPLRFAVVPSDYPGDLVLLRGQGLPAGPALAPATLEADPLYTVGADVARGVIAVFPPGEVLARPAEGHPLARLHHSALSQPGNSGGALLDAAGHLVAVVASGGEGRFEAVPAGEIARLRAASGPDKVAASGRLGAAVRGCSDRLDATATGRSTLSDAEATALADTCLATGNRQFFDLAAQTLGRRGRAEAAVSLFERSLAQDPNSFNARIGLVVTRHITGDYATARPQLDWLVERLPADRQVLRLALQAGKWGGDPALARRALALIESHVPAEAEAARRFLESDLPPPRPLPRN